MAFIEGIKDKARANVKTIVLPETEDERVIRAAAEVLKEKTANLVLLGNEEKIDRRYPSDIQDCRYFP